LEDRPGEAGVPTARQVEPHVPWLRGVDELRRAVQLVNDWIAPFHNEPRAGE